MPGSPYCVPFASEAPALAAFAPARAAFAPAHAYGFAPAHAYGFRDDSVPRPSITERTRRELSELLFPLPTQVYSRQDMHERTVRAVAGMATVLYGGSTNTCVQAAGWRPERYTRWTKSGNGDDNPEGTHDESELRKKLDRLLFSHEWNVQKDDPMSVPARPAAETRPLWDDAFLPNPQSRPRPAAETPAWADTFLPNPQSWPAALPAAENRVALRPEPRADPPHVGALRAAVRRVKALVPSVMRICGSNEEQLFRAVQWTRIQWQDWNRQFAHALVVGSPVLCEEALNKTNDLLRRLQFVASSEWQPLVGSQPAPIGRRGPSDRPPPHGRPSASSMPAAAGGHGAGGAYTLPASLHGARPVSREEMVPRPAASDAHMLLRSVSAAARRR